MKNTLFKRHLHATWRGREKGPARLTAKATHRVRRLECEAYMMDENSKRPKASRDIR